MHVYILSLQVPDLRNCVPIATQFLGMTRIARNLHNVQTDAQGSDVNTAFNA